MNHAIHGLAVPGYHVVNIGLHCLNGLLVALIVTQVRRLAGWRQQPRIPAEWVGAATACLWLVLLAPWCVLVGTALAVASSFGIRRRLAALPPLMFFALLAPTSSLIPCNELCTEHRMYAPLAPLCAVVAFAIARWLERLAGSIEGLRQPSWRALAFGLVIAALVVPLAAATKARNACYDSRLALRIDTVLKATSNPRAHRMLACELAILGRPKDALPFLRNAIELQPRYPLAYASLGQVFEMLGEKEQAVNAYARAAELNPANAAVKSRLQVLEAATDGPPAADLAPP